MAGEGADKTPDDQMGKQGMKRFWKRVETLNPTPMTRRHLLFPVRLMRLIQEAVAAALAEQQDMVLRAQAEVQNMRRRCEQDVEKAHKFALEKFGS